MKLFLASEAKHPNTIKSLEALMSGLVGKTIAYIPTAANGQGWESWKDGGTWEILKNLGAKITFVQLEEYHSQDVIASIKGHDIVWFAGGMPGYLLYWIRRTRLDKAMHEILSKSVYVGSSAGSMVAGNTLDVTEWYPGDEETGASIFPGLQLVDFDIYPHYEESMLPIIKEKYKGEKLYLLKNGEHIFVENEKITVVGEKRIVSYT